MNNTVRTALCLVAACFAFAGCTEKPATPKPAAKQAGALAVTVTAAKETTMRQVLALDAELVSLSTPVVASEVSGRLAAVDVVPGQKVPRGAVLAHIDSSDLALALTEAQAQAAQAQAQLGEKQRKLARDEELFAKAFLSRAAVQGTAADVEATSEQVRALQSRAELARRALAKAEVAAPYDAKVLERLAVPGAYVRAGDPLFKLWSPAASTLRLRIPQEHSGAVKAGQHVTLSWGDRHISTRIREVQSAIDPGSRAFQAYAEVPAELAAYAGAAVGAELEVSSETVLAVPAAAVQLRGPSAEVFVLENGVARRRPVRVGRTQDGMTALLEGLRAGDQVVVDGASFVTEGSKVQAVAR